MHSTLKRLAPVLIGTAALILLILWVGGVFRTGRIAPQDAVAPPVETVRDEITAVARRVSIPQRQSAVGTVQARTATRIEAQVSARVQRVAVHSGQRVEAGDLLVELDDRELRARHEQARHSLEAARQRRSQAMQRIEAAEATLRRAEANYERIRSFLEVGAATAQQMEEAEATFHQARAAREEAIAARSQAEAEIEGARRRLDEAAVALEFSRITAPVDGQVVDRLVEPGDLAMPGTPLVTLHSEAALRLEALVPEGLIGRLSLGDEIRVEIGDRRLSAPVEEIVPAADPRARSFVVKAALPEAPGLYPGMFGRLEIPLDEREAVVVPRAAVRRVGQLEMVRMVEDDVVRSRLVTTGALLDREVEILSGLSGGEKVIVHGEAP
jgi:HlyD family secretion protein